MGSGVGQAACSLDLFSIATAGFSGGTKSPSTSSARPRTELAAGSVRRAVISPAQSSIPTSSASFPPSLLFPSLFFLLLLQPRSAPSRSWAWHCHPLLPPCAQRLAVPRRAALCCETGAERQRSYLRGCWRVRGLARSSHARRAPDRPQPGPRLGASRHRFAANAPWVLGIKILTALCSRGRGGAGKCRVHLCLSMPSSPLFPLT